MQLVNNLPNLPKWLNIGLAFPVILLNGWLLIQFINYFQPLVSVISVAILLAFVLDYPIKLLQNCEISARIEHFTVKLQSE
jgi:predicted PurR-regulated permease PerM